MTCEVEVQGNFQTIETIFFDQLDQLLSEGRGDVDYKQTFYSILSAKCSSHPNAFIKLNGQTFVESVTRLVGLLIGLRSVPHGDEHRDSQAGCLYDVIRYYEFLNCEHLYLKYVYKLVDLHVSAGAFIEAAFTLGLHASKLHWSDDPLPEYKDNSAIRYVEQSHRERKIQIYRKIIDYFAEGHAWEYAIQYTKELAFQVC